MSMSFSLAALSTSVRSKFISGVTSQLKFLRPLFGRGVLFQPNDRELFVHQQRRNMWQEYIRGIPAKKDPSRLTFEDPGVVAARSFRTENAEGLHNRGKKRYEKPWMVRKRLKA